MGVPHSASLSTGQQAVDEAVTAAAWAIVAPQRNRALAELAVAATGLGNVADKFAKNRRKTMGLLRDLQGARSVGVIAPSSTIVARASLSHLVER